MQTPLIFTPLLKVRVWGGERLKSRAPGAPAEPVGESWEIADHDADTTVVAAGPHAGKSLHELLVEDKEGLCGAAVDPASPDRFPLMLKLIDPATDLSVQVHPNDAYAGEQVAGELGKTEAWYVLDAEPGGQIYRGLKEGVTREQFRSALDDGSVTNLLQAVPVKAGDVAFLPSGMVHALGGGVRIAEIQQNSDTTYRVFDWNRVGLDGNPRELHVDHALAVTDFGAGGESLCVPTPLPQEGCVREQFAFCEKFAFEKLSGFGASPVRLDTAGRSFHILTVTAGSATITAGGESVTRGAWDTCLVPAGAGAYTVSADSGTQALLFYRP